MDNFENQDLGGLPILKKETPSQEKDLGGLPILKKKEPTPSGFYILINMLKIFAKKDLGFLINFGQMRGISRFIAQ
jgi:hypothetical protein